MDKKIKVGIIGTGRIGRVHTMSITNYLPQVEIKGVTDIYPDQAREWAEQTGIRTVYKDYKEMIADPEIDAVLICSSTDTHAEIAVEAAKAGKHIFCEKPVDLSVEKVEAVIAAAKNAGVKLQIGFNRRFDHNFRKVKELIDNGTLGDLQILKITSRDPSPPPIEYVKVSGGIFMDMTIHDFDMARFLTGSEAEEVYVAAACMVDPAIGEAGDVDTALITIRFKNGVICVIDNSRKAAYGYDQRVEAFGSKGKAETANDCPSTTIWSTETGVYSEKPLYFFLERYMDSFAEEMKQFVNTLINGTDTPVTGYDGLQPIKLGLAARKSVAERRPVRLSEIE
ncbi:MAG TPA: inositol 2-dehydrogenase [Anaerovoracaceae bacterium]|nr:inositol 2-dehydrogenase [Anaerovoracaceae bacterium]